MPVIKRTYVEVVLEIDHSEVFSDDDLSNALTSALPGMTIAEGEALRLADGSVSKHTAIVEDVYTVWVKGSTP